MTTCPRVTNKRGFVALSVGKHCHQISHRLFWAIQPCLHLIAQSNHYWIIAISEQADNLIALIIIICLKGDNSEFW